jgi:hypothetical protein
MRKLTICILTICALALSSALWSQNPQQKAPEQQQKGESQRQAGDSYTGCLTETAGAFSLKTQAGENLTVTGSADLSKHKNHTVKVTGRVSEEGGKKSVSVTTIEHVSASCSS